MPKWTLLVTRETDLYERYLRVLGYRRLLGKATKFKVENILVVNHNGLTDQYLFTPDRQKRIKILRKEYKERRLNKLLPVWKKIIKDLSRAAQEFEHNPNARALKTFQVNYELGRGIVLYSEELGRVLERSSAKKDLKLLGYWHELSESTTSCCWDRLKKVLLLRARKQKVTPKDLTYYLPSELEKFFLNKKEVSPETIKDRRKYYLLIMRRGKIKLYLGQKGQEVENRELPKVRSLKIETILGSVANRGFARGRIRIINTFEQMRKMRQGEIIVSVMTTSRLLPAIRKAAAIVTNEGGMICHAAIVSRELGIPCVVGTKIATQILKDGDLVEVDANKGIVRRLADK